MTLDYAESAKNIIVEFVLPLYLYKMPQKFSHIRFSFVQNFCTNILLYF